MALDQAAAVGGSSVAGPSQSGFIAAGQRDANSIMAGPFGCWKSRPITT
jgi:hypothetical protein